MMPLAVHAIVDCVIAGGVYFNVAQTEAWSASGVLPIFPPTLDRARSARATLAWSHRELHQRKDYMRSVTNLLWPARAREVQILRIKRCIGCES